MDRNRKLIQRNETKVSILQIIGFVLLVIGVVSLVVCSFCKLEQISTVISISFFITMLGFSFAFPSLLEGNDGLSTLRIVVFMVTNVVCMLLLRIGWSQGIQSLKNIGLDQYWVALIAFVFGAKATQSFFESRMANLGGQNVLTSPNQDNGQAEVPERIIKEAIDKNSRLCNRLLF